MANRRRVMWIGDGVVSTGFARVSDSVLNSLQTQYDVSHLAINYRGDPHPYNYNVYPAFLGGDIFGFGRVVDLIGKIKPDAIVIIQDPWIIDVYLDVLKDQKNLPPIIVYFPVDAESLNPMWFRHYKLVSSVNVYTEFGREEVAKLFLDDVCCSKVNIIPHGIDTNNFFELDKEMAKRAIYPDKKVDQYLNGFIVLNANRNQPRKRIDLTLFGFSRFAKTKNDAFLYLHMGRLDEGWDILEMSRKLGITEKIIITNTNVNLPDVSIERLNLIYNATDVGINTSTGEGWGLTNWEHGATGKPQIVPNHSACKELWKNGGGFIFDATEPFANTKICTVGRVATVESVSTGLEAAYQMWKHNNRGFMDMGRQAKSLVTNPKYSWKSVADLFSVQIEKVTANANNIS